MWLELGGNVLVDLDCFYRFSLYTHDDDDYIIYGLSNHGNDAIYRSPDPEDIREQFEKIRHVLMEEQRQWAERLERVSKVG